MLSADIVRYTATLTFGHTTAQFKQLIAMMAAISIALWIIVLISILVRIGVYHLWYRRRFTSPRNMPPI